MSRILKEILLKEYELSIVTSKPTEQFIFIITEIVKDVIKYYKFNTLYTDLGMVEKTSKIVLNQWRNFDQENTLGLTMLEYYKELSKRCVLTAQKTINNKSLYLSLLNAIEYAPEESLFKVPSGRYSPLSPENTEYIEVNKTTLIEMIDDNKISHIWIRDTLMNNLTLWKSTQ